MLLPDQTYEQSCTHIENMIKTLSCYQKQQQQQHQLLPKQHIRTKKSSSKSFFYASSSNEAVHLQQRLQSLSSELVTLRNSLHVQNQESSEDLDLDQVEDVPAVFPRKNVPAIASKDSSAELFEDLIHLSKPLNENVVLKCLQARFLQKHYYTNIGPLLLCVNSFQDVGNDLTLSSAKDFNKSVQLNRIVREAVRQQSETGYPQAIILSGTSGSGKSYASMLLLRQLFVIAGGGSETDSFKHLSAAFTVLRSLGSAKTTNNSESSRIGQFIEIQVSDAALYRTKIHCYFLDQTRIIKQSKDEQNYHIFYQMISGLNSDERIKLKLDGYSITSFKYLSNGKVYKNSSQDSARFRAWKNSLGVLGIPFLDIVRVLSTVLLLGNIEFFESNNNVGCDSASTKTDAELNSIATLLGVSYKSLLKGLTTRTRTINGCLVKSLCDSNFSNQTRNCLAKALYCRTVAAIVRRANSLKRLGSTLGTVSTDSNESVHTHQPDLVSQHYASTISGPNTNNSSNNKSMAALSNAVRHVTDGFIGILDMFGFENANPSQLEHLCSNLCSETLQHFYNTHIFKSSLESCREEGINCDLEIDYVDNVPCIDVISSLQSGLLSMLDVECSIRGNPESYVTKIKSQHKDNQKLFDPKKNEDSSFSSATFGIEHFSGKVIYSAEEFLETNRDIIPDDLVVVFSKLNCNFAFATLLFSSELKALSSMNSIHDDKGYQKLARGVSFRISPTSHTDFLNGTEPISTLTQDFHTRLDNLLRTLVHAKPHFIRCIKSNTNETPNEFDISTISSELKSLEVVETLNLMSGGYPHRMRFKAFNARYRPLAPFPKQCHSEDKALYDSKIILDFSCSANKFVDHWAVGKRHIFMSEHLRQYLEKKRSQVREKSAIRIQAAWRGHKARCQFIRIRTSCLTISKPSSLTNGNSVVKPRPHPIAGTPTPPEIPAPPLTINDDNIKHDLKLVEKACKLFALNPERAPPVPPSRSYTIYRTEKIYFPQKRLMKQTYPEICSYDDKNLTDSVLRKGDCVTVLGSSNRRGHLVVNVENNKIHVPFQYLQLKND